MAVLLLSRGDCASHVVVAQPHVSELKSGKLDRFNSARMLRFLTLLDRDIEIVIRRKGRGRMVGVVRVSTD